ncbi:unnamed protein product [Albugo candida]|uniref:Uncharacterized protein n=1 Tax=Albugo candida TaxID=65357 RepID=A0A024G8D1_9STRA|nr:unnamed protein product [Albugo candida]|eukprot:CCI43136.1 unnamed protein product [Albugo candida]
MHFLHIWKCPVSLCISFRQLMRAILSNACFLHSLYHRVSHSTSLCVQYYQMHKAEGCGGACLNSKLIARCNVEYCEKCTFCNIHTYGSSPFTMCMFYLETLQVTALDILRMRAFCFLISFYIRNRMFTKGRNTSVSMLYSKYQVQRSIL